MKTWTNPTVEELEVALTAGGTNPSYVEYEGTGPITGMDRDDHFCPFYDWTGECPHGHNHNS